MKRFLNADSLASTGQGFLGFNMFAYCRNSPIGCTDSNGYRDDSIWSIEHDEQGVVILLHWLFGDGEELVFEDGEWGAYMRNNESLYAYTISIVKTLATDLKPGETINVQMTTSAVIENGESIIGYQYLHGTDADAGGYQINGTVGKDSCGNITYDIRCTWNDMINPNYSYTSDSKKATLAKFIPFSTCKDYRISISWTLRNPSYNSGGGRIRTQNELART